MPTYTVVDDPDNPEPMQHPGITLVDHDGGPYNPATSIPDGTYVQSAGLSNGVDDTASLAAKLVYSAVGTVVRGVPGQTYLISSPLPIYSNGTLNMTGATVRLIAGSNCQMLKNAGQTPTATGTGTSTVGSNVITTALAAQAVVGQTLTLAGAISASSPITGKISAVNTGAGTVTLTTLEGAAVNALVAVTGGVATLYTRDTDIAVIGGYWDRQNNAGGASNLTLNSISIVHCDGVTIEGVRYGSTAGKYGIYLADVTKFVVRAIRFAGASDGVHVSGPATRGSIRDVQGTAGDDLVALTANNYAGYNETVGDITDVHVDAIAGNSSQNLMRIIAGLGCTVDRIMVNGVYGAGASHAVDAGDDTASPNTQGGTYGTLTYRGVHGAGGAAGSQMAFRLPNCRKLIIEDSTWVMTSGTYGIHCSGSGTISHMRVDGYTCSGAGAGKLSIFLQQTAILKLDIIDFSIPDLPTAASDAIRVASGVITDMVVDRANLRFGDTTTCSTVAFQGTASVVNLHLARSYIFQGRSGIIDTPATTPLIHVTVTDCVFKGTNRFTNLSSPAEFYLTGVTADTLLNAALYLNNAASTIVVRGGPVRSIGAFTLLARTASQPIRVNGPQLTVDLALVTPTDGDMAFNTNAGLACGTGPATYNTAAAKWKGIYSGVVYP